jgi:adenylate cyclase
LAEQEEWFRDGDVAAKDRAFELAKRAHKLDPEDARIQVILGYVHLYRRDLDKAEYHHRRAIALNPNDAHLAAHMGLLQGYLGCAQDGLEWFRKAARLNPYPPVWYGEFQAMTLFAARRYDEAITFLEQVDDLHFWDCVYLAATYAQANRPGDAQGPLGACEKIRPGASVVTCAAGEPYRNAADLEHLIDGLRKAGASEA